MTSTTRRAAVIVLGASSAALLLGTVLTQLPGWAAIGDWLSRWWPLPLAAALAGASVALFRRGTPRPAPTAVTTSTRWESEPGRPGLLPRTTATPGPGPGRRWNWTAITSLVTAATAVAALGFTAQSLSATNAQIALAEQGQITDRYTKAIDQLGTQGAEHLQTRLGGIYALERLMTDSPRDQPTIIEILSAFIRSTLPSTQDTSTEEPPFGGKGCFAHGFKYVQIDTRAALSVLGRRDPGRDHGTAVNLRDACLATASLAGANFTGADFTGADFASVDLTGADLTNAHLAGAGLNGAHLHGAKLVNASADLGRTDLHGADLSGANLSGVEFHYVHLYDTNLTGADLSYAKLTAADLNRSNLTGALLHYTDFTGADLSDADVSNAVHDTTTKMLNAKKDHTKGAWW